MLNNKSILSTSLFAFLLIINPAFADKEIGEKCSMDIQCGIGMKCADGICGKKCSMDIQCGDFKCENEACTKELAHGIKECSMDIQCGTGKKCSPKGYCGKKCSMDIQCGTEFKCIDEICTGSE
jgi:hypothetical protein